jgi:hypothetical protein
MQAAQAAYAVTENAAVAVTGHLILMSCLEQFAALMLPKLTLLLAA